METSQNWNDELGCKKDLAKEWIDFSFCKLRKLLITWHIFGMEIIWKHDVDKTSWYYEICWQEIIYSIEIFWNLTSLTDSLKQMEGVLFSFFGGKFHGWSLLDIVLSLSIENLNRVTGVENILVGAISRDFLLYPLGISFPWIRDLCIL